ncbi:hypothetical protein BDW59DRAFT_163251 [Aspergillus cavernicola]|uniref:Uncharacterized protein n=1 Tax=Aspergillus cavernicola TaxID=176166 RepID=A0ABR4I6U6_9EURO
MSTVAPPLDTTPPTDTSSLATSPIERRGSLEKHLLTRPDPQDLKDKHILLDTNVAPSIQAMRQKLDRQKVSDNLKKNLEHRPERDELVDLYGVFLG